MRLTVIVVAVIGALAQTFNDAGAAQSVTADAAVLWHFEAGG
jgi:hypothetical protein